LVAVADKAPPSYPTGSPINGPVCIVKASPLEESHRAAPVPKGVQPPPLSTGKRSVVAVVNPTLPLAAWKPLEPMLDPEVGLTAFRSTLPERVACTSPPVSTISIMTAACDAEIFRTSKHKEANIRFTRCPLS